MEFDDYVERMATAHQEFMTAMMAMQAAYGKTQTVFTDLVRDVKRELTALHDTQTALQESNDELKQMILEQGAQIRALRERLNGH